MGRILYISHDADRPRGGVSILYDHVAALRRHGFDAYIVHASANFRYAFGRPDVPVLHANARLAIDSTDTLLVPEDHGPVIAMCRNLKCRKVLFVQNHFYFFHGLKPGDTWSDIGFSAYLALSAPIAQAMKRWFGVTATVVRPAIDDVYFADTDSANALRTAAACACMPRKGTAHLRLVQGLLAANGFAHKAGVSWVTIDGLQKEQVAARLREATIYVSTGVSEGLGLPPLEAMACGCLVVGFAADGGRDYASPGNGVWVQDEDPWALAEALTDTITGLADPSRRAGLAAKCAAGQAMAQTYNRERFEREVVAFWSALQ